jgi:predicted O-methyltransferase YrrM
MTCWKMDEILELASAHTPEPIQSYTQGIQLDDLKVLETFARELRPKLIAEVGTNQGFSATRIARAAKDSLKTLYTVDILNLESCWARFQHQFKSSEMAGHVRFIHGNVTNLPNESFDLAFIDGDHTQAGARKDCEGLRDKMTEDGVILGHDSVSETLQGYKDGLPDWCLHLAFRNSTVSCFHRVRDLSSGPNS